MISKENTSKEEESNNKSQPQSAGIFPGNDFDQSSDLDHESGDNGERSIANPSLLEKPRHPDDDHTTPNDITEPTEPNDSPIHYPNSDRPNISYTREAFLVFVTVSSQLMTQATVAQGVTLGHLVAKTFNTTDAGELSWYAAGFSLTAGTFIVSSGRLGEMYGHKNLFIIGYLFLSLWTLLAGISSYSNSSRFFSFCRGMQGVGCAILIPNGLAILGTLYKPGTTRKNIVFALFGAVAPGGFMLGGIMGTLIAKYRWEFSFYVGAIVSFIYAISCYFIIPNYEKGLGRSHEPFDLVGALTGISGLILFNVAWNQAPVVGWETVYVYVLLILGVLLFTIFVFVELRVSHPLVPLRGMHTSTILVLASVACGWGCFGIWNYYIWQFLTTLRGANPLVAACQMSPALIVGFLAAGVAAYLFPRLSTSYLMCISMVAFIIPSILLATNSIHQTYWAGIFVSTLIGPFGMDISFPAATILLSQSVPKESQGIAASLVATVVNYSISMGLGLAGTLVRYTTPEQDPISQMRAVRYASYLGIGLSSLGLVLSVIGVFVDRKHAKQQAEMESSREAESSIESNPEQT